jgi:KipI family sensor histidine kinase inhibitor
VTETRPFRIVAAGDSVLVAEFEDRIDEAVNSRVVALAEALGQKSIAGVRDIVPTFRSVAIYFDPLRTDVGGLSRLLEEEDLSNRMVRRESATVRIPVCYGGSYGPDLEAVAASTGLSEAAVADLHAGSTYRVYMLGFLPGFAYMGLVDERIAVPRRAVPRVRVPTGSVGIAGRQTGIYPSDSPGGWQLIGKTPVRPFDVKRPRPFLLAAGDQVQFYRIDASEFERAAAQ